MVATLNGHRITDARVNIPAWGCWYASATVDGEHALTGAVTLKIADLTLTGTILSGGAMKGRSSFRVVAGKGGWGREVPSKGYASDAGVKRSTVIQDAAQEVGESVTGLDVSARIGPGWVRKKGPASRVLEQLAPNAWYVDEAGVTHLGARSASVLPGGITRVTPADISRATVELASDAIAAILPGVVVDGIAAIDVEHEVTPNGIRSRIWGARSGASANATSRALAAFRVLIDQLDPDRNYRGVTEYRVVTQEGDRLNLQPVRVSTGMPSLRRVTMRPGVSGAKSTVALGSLVLVAFVDASPARPVVVGFSDAESDGFTPILTEIDASTFVKVADGARPVGATGDLAGGIWPLAGTTRILG